MMSRTDHVLYPSPLHFTANELMWEVFEMDFMFILCHKLLLLGSPARSWSAARKSRGKVDYFSSEHTLFLVCM